MGKNLDGRFVPQVRGEHLFKHPTIVKPGFGESASSFSEFSQALSERGHKVFTDEHPIRRSQQEVKQLLGEAKAHAKRWYAKHRPDLSTEDLEVLLSSVPLTVFEEAYSLVEIILKTAGKGEPVTVVGHSLGAAASVYAAFLWPDLFPEKNGEPSHLALLNPAGLTGKEGVKKSKSLEASGKVLKSRLAVVAEIPGDLGRQLGIIGGFLFAGIKALVSAPNAKTRSAAGGGLLYTLSEYAKFSSRIEQEAYDVSSTDLLPFLKVVHGNGVQMHAVLDSRDSLFQEKKIKKRLAESGLEISIYSTEGYGHFGPTKHPDEVADIVTEALSSKRTH